MLNLRILQRNILLKPPSPAALAHPAGDGAVSQHCAVMLIKT
jgi:hypothetical protein